LYVVSTPAKAMAGYEAAPVSGEVRERDTSTPAVPFNT